MFQQDTNSFMLSVLRVALYVQSAYYKVTSVDQIVCLIANFISHRETSL